MHSLKNFNRKENTMQYMTNRMLQRFMSHMSNEIMWIQQDMVQERKYAVAEAVKFGASSKRTRELRDELSKLYVKYSEIQTNVKYFPLQHFLLQQMEKKVTGWINFQQMVCFNTYEDYLENRYDPFYRNRSKQAKQKLAKLVELQQAIRKQKRITRN